MDPYAQIMQGSTATTPPQAAESSNPYAQIMEGARAANDQSLADPYSQILTPSDLSNATAQTGSQDENGECQKFVEQMVYGHTGIFPSAIDAWDAYAKDGQARMGTQGVRPGDLLYFAPDQSNQNAGHTGIYMGGDKFISATDNGVMPYNLADWQKQTGQQLLGYVKPR